MLKKTSGNVDPLDLLSKAAATPREEERKDSHRKKKGSIPPSTAFSGTERAVRPDRRRALK